MGGRSPAFVAAGLVKDGRARGAHADHIILDRLGAGAKADMARQLGERHGIRAACNSHEPSDEVRLANPIFLFFSSFFHFLNPFFLFGLAGWLVA